MAQETLENGQKMVKKDRSGWKQSQKQSQKSNQEEITDNEKRGKQTYQKRETWYKRQQDLVACLSWSKGV